MYSCIYNGSWCWFFTYSQTCLVGHLYITNRSIKGSLILPLMNSTYNFNMYIKGTFSGSLEWPFIYRFTLPVIENVYLFLIVKHIRCHYFGRYYFNMIPLSKYWISLRFQMHWDIEILLNCPPQERKPLFSLQN